MNLNYQLSRLSIALRELRAPFFTASIIPVLVGTALAYAAKGIFNPLLFTLATITMIFLHAGANMANDYFDHLSGNDWGNRNPTPFSGGSQLIQQGLILAMVIYKLMTMVKMILCTKYFDLQKNQIWILQ